MLGIWCLQEGFPVVGEALGLPHLNDICMCILCIGMCTCVHVCILCVCMCMCMCMCICILYVRHTVYCLVQGLGEEVDTFNAGRRSQTRPCPVTSAFKNSKL